VLGYSNEEFLHSLASDFMHPDEIPAYIEIRKKIIQSPGKAFYHQLRLRHINGNWIWCEGTVTNWLHLAGVEALVTTFRDITEKKEFQENLEAAHKKAETERERITADLLQRNKDLEQFTYIVSHNLRAPVANIMGTSEALRTMKLEDSEKEDMMFSLSASVMKLNGVIRDLNNILQTKRNMSEKREIASFSHLIKNIKISIDDQIKNERVEIKTDFSEIDKMLTLKSYLYSVFFNLISNSIKFRQPEISPVIEIKSYHMQDKIEIHFSDNGVGIDLKTKGDQVFGLYKRFHAEVEGKGMGLFMVKTQVEALGGKIGIESEVNKGTKFILQFPL
jgi:PAS domain S-box-containing protein